MTTAVKDYLNNINEISRQLLSLFDSQLDNSDASNDQSQFIEQEIAKFVTKRQSQVTKLFELFTQEQLSREIQLINDMVSFDQQLISKAQEKKQQLAEQIVKLKTSKKVTSTYQKY